MKGLAIAWIIISFTDIIYTAYKAGQKYQRQSVLREDDPVYKAVRSKITGIVH